MIGIPIIVVLYLLFRPLNRIKVTENLEPIVQTKAREKRIDELRNIELGENNVRGKTQAS